MESATGCIIVVVTSEERDAKWLQLHSKFVSTPAAHTTAVVAAFAVYINPAPPVDDISEPCLGPRNRREPNAGCGGTAQLLERGGRDLESSAMVAGRT